ncbi:MAG: S1C family serine protease, partial [Phycisphaerae bacterium]|nr:S1C family serine protease [Phycisphaerae bacterium]
MRLNYFTIILALVALGASALLIVERSLYVPQDGTPLQSENWIRWQKEYGQTAAMAVVAIESDKPTRGGQQIVQNSGSGFIIDASGLIVTNQHV